MRDAGFDPVPAFNPYRDREGVTFEDPDGYRIVLEQATWTRSAFFLLVWERKFELTTTNERKNIGIKPMNGLLRDWVGSPM